MKYNLPAGMQLQIIPPLKDGKDYTLYITDGSFHYHVVYAECPSDEHIEIHLQRAQAAFGSIEETISK